jgi:GTPase
MKVFTHKHEIMSGITQSVSHEVIGFDSNGKIYNQSIISSWENLLDLSTKIMTFIDVGGHKKA